MRGSVPPEVVVIVWSEYNCERMQRGWAAARGARVPRRAAAAVDDVDRDGVGAKRLIGEVLELLLGVPGVHARAERCECTRGGVEVLEVRLGSLHQQPQLSRAL